MYYIQETDKFNYLFKLFNIIKLKDDKIILPIEEAKFKKEIINIAKSSENGIKESLQKQLIKNKEIAEKTQEKLAQKTISILQQTNCRKVVISKQIKKQERYIKILKDKKIKVVDGKWLFKILMSQVLEYIILKKDLQEEKVQISILTNNTEEIVMNNIRKIARKYKKVSVVSSQLEKFKKMEKQLLEDEGLVLTVSNNKRQSLFNSQIILNVDFDTESINKYRIFEEAIIVNFQENVEILQKRFNGMNINDYEISVSNKEKLNSGKEIPNYDKEKLNSGKEIPNYKKEKLDYEKEIFNCDKENLYDAKDIYEAEIYQNRPLEYIRGRIERDGIRIIRLIGRNNFL